MTTTKEQKPFYEDEKRLERDQEEVIADFDRKHPTYRLPSSIEEFRSDQKTKSNNEKEKHEDTVFKYSKRFKGLLHEAILLKDRPAFLRLGENKNVQTVYKIIEEQRILVPPSIENYPYEPIEFESEHEIKRFIDKARKETIESLFQRVFKTISQYIDQDEDIRIIISADIVWTYFQDLFPTTHYYDVTGTGNGIGKSTRSYV